MKTVQEVYDYITARQEHLSETLRTKGLDLDTAHPFKYFATRLSPASPSLILNSAAEEKPDLDEEGFKATFTITTPTVDRYGDVVMPKGCIASLSSYRRNPRVFFNHKTNEIPIGSCRTPLGELALQFMDDRVLGTVRFHEETPESRIIARLVFRRELEAASIGFLPIKAAPFEPAKTVDRPDEDADGDPLIYVREDPVFKPLKFHSWELHEWSIVGVPANADCLASHLSRGTVEGDQISPVLRKALEPFAAKRNVTMGYTPPSPEQVSAAVEAMAEKEKELIEKSVSLPQGFSLNDKTKHLMKDGEPYVTYELLEQLKDLEKLYKEVVGKAAKHDEYLRDLNEGRVIYVKGGDILSSSLDAYKRDMGLDNLIGPPETSTEDKEKDWPLGAKFLSLAVRSYGEMCGWMGEMDKQLDQPRVKKLAAKKVAKLQKLSLAALKLGAQVYPDKFSYEETPQEKSVREEKQKNKVTELIEKWAADNLRNAKPLVTLEADKIRELEEKFNEEKARSKKEEEAIVKALESTVAALQRTQTIIFEVTGRK